MGNKLNALLDFQKYEKNPKLQAVINSVHARYSGERLSDDEVEFVAAAGMPKTAPEVTDLADKKNGLA